MRVHHRHCCDLGKSTVATEDCQKVELKETESKTSRQSLRGPGEIVGGGVRRGEWEGDKGARRPGHFVQLSRLP